MNPVLIFLFALICILLFTAKLRIHPFLSLVSVSILTGVLAGDPLGAVEAATSGMGRVFSHFAIIITCGSVIGIVLQRTGGTSVIAGDIIRFSRNPLLALNFLGFLFSVPVMCCILAYVIFVPIAKELAARLGNPSISTATALAMGTLASFNLVYPSPVIISASEELGANTDLLVLLGFFIAVPTSIAGYLYARKLGAGEGSGTLGPSGKGKEQPSGSGESAIKEVVEEKANVNPRRLEAYVPVFFPLILILSKTVIEHPLFAFLGDPNVALLIGVLLSLFSGRGLGLDVLRTLVEKAVRRGGVVLLDLCGGGALGATLAITGAGEALGQMFMQLNLPHIVVPFLVAAALQTVQGSRVVTMLVAPSLIMPLVPQLGLPVEILILAMASGTFLFSHVNDPFFWIFGELAEIEPPQVFRAYTLGGALMGAVSFLLVCGVYLIAF